MSKLRVVIFLIILVLLAVGVSWGYGEDVKEYKKKFWTEVLCIEKEGNIIESSWGRELRCYKNKTFYEAEFSSGEWKLKEVEVE